jgi:hypothetical protein
MAMDDDVGVELQRRQELHLIRTFLRISDSGKRQRVLDLAEQLAEEAAFDAAEPGPAKAPTVDERKEITGEIE